MTAPVISRRRPQEESALQRSKRLLSSPSAEITSAATDDFVLPKFEASAASSDQASQAPETPTKQSSKWTNELRISLLVAVLNELDHTFSRQTWHKIAESLKPKKPSITLNSARFEVARLIREHSSTAPAPTDQHDQPAETVKDEKDED